MRIRLTAAPARRAAVLLLALGAALPAFAGLLQVTVTGANGRPAADASRSPSVGNTIVDAR